MDEEKDENPNIEWKKTDFGESEKVGLGVNVKEAEKYEAKKKTAVSPAANRATMPIGLNKIRKKIKDVMEDEEEDENDYQLATGANTFMILENALTDDEKQVLSKMNERNVIKQQQNAGKMESMLFLNRFVKETGMKNLDQAKMIENINDSTLSGKDVLRNSIKDEVAKNANIQWSDLSDRELVGFLRGVKKIHKVGGSNAVEGMKIKDVLEAGEVEIKGLSDEKKIAEIIMRKRGLKKEEKTKELGKIKKMNPKVKASSAMDRELQNVRGS